MPLRKLERHHSLPPRGHRSSHRRPWDKMTGGNKDGSQLLAVEVTSCDLVSPSENEEQHRQQEGVW